MLLLVINDANLLHPATHRLLIMFHNFVDFLSRTDHSDVIETCNANNDDGDMAIGNTSEPDDKPKPPPAAEKDDDETDNSKAETRNEERLSEWETDSLFEFDPDDMPVVWPRFIKAKYENQELPYEITNKADCILYGYFLMGNNLVGFQ